MSPDLRKFLGILVKRFSKRLIYPLVGKSEQYLKEELTVVYGNRPAVLSVTHKLQMSKIQNAWTVLFTTDLVG
jgi:hypothetical protein